VTLPHLMRLEQLTALSPEDKQVLADAIVSTVTMGPNKDLVRQGEEPVECYLILDGMLQRYKVLGDGARQIVGFHITGDLCDLNGPVIGRMDHSIATVTASKLAVIPRAALLEIIERRPRIGIALWKETIVDAAIAREWVANVGRRTPHQRIAHLLCEMGRRLEAAGRAEDGKFEWPVTQADVAEAMGLSTVHVSRVYQQLRKDGLLVTEDGVVHVLDWHRLEEVGEFTPDYLFLPSSTRQEHASA
jgi:CRP-like cAMP-binding protein